MRFMCFWLALGIAGVSSARATTVVPTGLGVFSNGFALPMEIVSYQALCSELRSRIGLKFRDMRQNFQLKETRSGELEFRDGQGMRVARVVLRRSLNEARTERMEWVRVYDASDVLILEEKVETGGTDLAYGSAMNRIFFEGEPDYDLTPTETAKTISIGSGTQPLFRFVIRRSPPGERDGVETRYMVFVGRTQALEVRRLEEATGVRVEYQLMGGSIELEANGRSVVIPSGQATTFRVTLKRPRGYLAESIRYFKDSSELYGLSAFLTLFNPLVYDSLVLGGVIAAAETVIVPQFPVTERIRNVAASGRFLDDLIRLRTLVDQAKQNPVQLSQVSLFINSFIGALQEGTLMVTDNRPKEN